MSLIWTTGRAGDCRDRDRRRGEQEQRGDAFGLVCPESLRSVTKAAHDKGEAQDEERVGQDGAHEGCPDYVNQPCPQGEDADEELGQVAQGGLQDAGGPVAEARTQLVCALAD